MAVSEQTPYSEHTGNGITTSFALGFKCKEKAHLIVKLNDENASVNTWTLSSDTVVFSTAPTSGTKIFLQRKTPNRRTTNYQSFNNSFNPTAINEDLDTVWLRLQEEEVSKFLLNQLINMNYKDLDEKGQNIRIELISKLTDQANQLNNQIFQQGVTQKQLQDYYSFLQNQMANLSSNKNWVASLIADASGKNQQEINNNTAFFYRTMAEMLADKKLADGVVVATKGYHNISDDGGAVYLISSTATDYSIPLENGLHAIFRDTFDIRKFGIRDSKTLDQTAELQRMIAYADSRFYEIDFHGFNIRKPNILQMGKGDIPINGLIFNHAHKLKNLKPCNDKTAVLQQDSSCIAFMPKSNPETIEVFELDNVVFDPHVANYNITAGYYDGNMHGFIAHPHIESDDLIAWGTQKTNFGFRFKDIKSISPAISYNITTAAVFAQFIETDNISGEFIGCYINNHSVRHNFKNTHGVYRDDLHDSTRLLVTSLIHHEPELAGGSIDIQGFNLDNISCIKHSDQTNHVSFKVHVLGTITIDEVQANNVRGRFEFYAASGNNSKVKDLLVSNSQELAPSLMISIDKTLFDNTPVNDLLFVNGTKRYITCELKDSVVNAGIIYDGCTLDELFLDRATITSADFGLVRAEAYIKEININDIRVSGGRFVFCKFDQIKGNGLTITDTPTVAGEFLQAIANTAPSAVKITGVKALVSTPGYFINKYAGHVLNADIRFSEFLVMPAFNTDTLHYELNSPQNTYNTPFYPPAIAAGASVTKEIAVAGAKVGDPVTAAFTQYNASVSVNAVVSAVDIVLVTFKNNGASSVTVSGSINLRI